MQCGLYCTQKTRNSCENLRHILQSTLSYFILSISYASDWYFFFYILDFLKDNGNVSSKMDHEFSWTESYLICLRFFGKVPSVNWKAQGKCKERTRFVIFLPELKPFAISNRSLSSLDGWYTFALGCFMINMCALSLYSTNFCLQVTRSSWRYEQELALRKQLTSVGQYNYESAIEFGCNASGLISGVKSLAVPG